MVKHLIRRPIPKDSSGRNLLTNLEKRERLVSFYYALGTFHGKKERSLDDWISLDTEDPELLKSICAESNPRKQRWWKLEQKENHPCLVYGGDSKQFWIVPKKLTYGPDHRKSIHKFMHLIYTPFFLQVLFFARGKRDGDRIEIDMSSYLVEDLQDISIWYKFQTGYPMDICNGTSLTFSSAEFHQALEERKWPEKRLQSKRM